VKSLAVNLLLLLISATPVWAQQYTQRGFIENRFTLYPQEAANDRARTVGEALFRYEGFYKPAAAFQFNVGLDIRTDTHHQVEREAGVSWWDREQQRPLAAIRRLSGVYHNGGLAIEIGKQFVRWGKADVLNPTDRFAPRDFLAVVDNEFLGITAARATYEKGSETIDLVWSPRSTPSRTPLLDQRWVVLPEGLPPFLQLREIAPHYPGGPQLGARWNHVGLLEFSASYYEGFNHLPLFEARPADPTTITLQKFYPKMRMIGADGAIPLHQFGVKAEVAHFLSSDLRADEYTQYIIQLERHSGEWTFVGGYAGESVSRTGTQTIDFAPDRGLSKTFLGTARYTIDANRGVAFEGSLRQNGDGAWLRSEYSQAVGQHWRATVNFTLIRGEPSDFLGQYRRNSHVTLFVRYNF